MLENSLHHVSKKDELSFSVDIVMTEPVTFYQKLVTDLGLRPVNAGQITDKKLVFLKVQFQDLLLERNNSDSKFILEIWD